MSRSVIKIEYFLFRLTIYKKRTVFSARKYGSRPSLSISITPVINIGGFELRNDFDIRYTSAAEQAQQVWNQSRVLQLFKSGEIFRGRFGYQVVETGYIPLLGACGQTDRVWREEENQSEFMENKPLREFLSFALDVNDYRDFLGLSPNL